MTTANTGSRALAIAAGIAFAGGALSILLQNIMDVQHPAHMLQHWTLQHTLAVLTVVGVILAGELAREARLGRRYGAWAGFWLVVLIGTAVVVYNSVGRQAESTGTTTLSVEDRNDQRAEVKKSLSEHQRMLDEELAEHAREAAAGGCGKKCQGIEQSITVYQAAIAGDEAKIKTLGAPEPDAPKAETFAELLSMIFGVDKAKAKALLTLLEPFAWTLMFEFGSIVSWGHVRRPRETVKASKPSREFPDPRDTAQTSFPVPAELPRPMVSKPRVPSNSGNSGNRPNGGAVSKIEAERDLVTRLALGETVSSQDDLVARWGVPKGTVSKWLSEWESRKLIPARKQYGRRKQLANSPT